MIKIKTGVSIPEAIMKVIDTAAAGWFCDRSAAITRIVQDWEQLRSRQLPLVTVVSPQETEAELMHRLQVQELPGFIPNDVVKVNSPHPQPPSTSSGQVLSQGERGESSYLGTGPGDEVG